MLLAQQQHQRRNQKQRTTTGTTRTTTDGNSGSNVWWCCGVVAVLKWLEILFAIVVIAVLIPILCLSPGQYDFIMFVGAFCLCVTALTLIIYFFRLHIGPLKALPWRKVEIGLNILMVLLYLTAAGIGIYHCIKLFQHQAYHEIGRNHRCESFMKDRRFDVEWRGRIATVMAFCIVNGILHIFSAIYARRVLI